MSTQRFPTGPSAMKIFFLLIASQLILLKATTAQCPRGSAHETICASCSYLPGAKHFADSCCSQRSAYDFCANCFKNFVPCLRELTNLPTRRAPIMKQDANHLESSKTNKRTPVNSDNRMKPSKGKSIHPSFFSKRVPEILVPAPPVDDQKRQGTIITLT